MHTILHIYAGHVSHEGSITLEYCILALKYYDDRR